VLTTTGRRWDDDEWRKMGEYAEGLQVWYVRAGGWEFWLQGVLRECNSDWHWPRLVLSDAWKLWIFHTCLDMRLEEGNFLSIELLTEDESTQVFGSGTQESVAQSQIPITAPSVPSSVELLIPPRLAVPHRQNPYSPSSMGILNLDKAKKIWIMLTAPGIVQRCISSMSPTLGHTIRPAHASYL
jgi:hypothetical protein